ncbi:MAG: c-type cytochrome [Candidatus Binataceae bacterium]
MKLLLAAFAGCVLAAALPVAGCAPPKPLTQAQRGKVIYRQNCISCHNENPRLPGSVGPPIAGSPRALLRARLIHDSYPRGYHPKRHTHIMRSMPWLAPHIGEIAAYLALAAHPAPSPSALQAIR